MVPRQDLANLEPGAAETAIVHNDASWTLSRLYLQGLYLQGLLLWDSI